MKTTIRFTKNNVEYLANIENITHIVKTSGRVVKGSTWDTLITIHFVDGKCIQISCKKSECDLIMESLEKAMSCE